MNPAAVVRALPIGPAPHAGVLRHSKDAFHTSGDAAHDTTDRTTYCPTDGAGCACARVRALGRAAPDPLRSSGDREGHQGGENGSFQNVFGHSLHSLHKAGCNSPI